MSTKFQATTKQVGLPAYTERQVLYDSQQIKEGVGQVAFFPPDAAGARHLANYEENPFPGRFRRVIQELAFELNARALFFDTAADAEAFLNNVENAYAEIYTGDTRCGFVRYQLTDLLSVDFEVMPIRGELADGAQAADGVMVVAKPKAAQRVLEPIVMEPNDRLYLEVTFPASAGLPAAAGTNGTPGGDLFLRAKLGVARWTQEQQQAVQQTRTGVAPVRQPQAPSTVAPSGMLV